MARTKAGGSRRPVDRGQSMVEYAIILVCVAVVVIVALRLVGGNTNNSFNSVHNGLSGGSSTASRSCAACTNTSPNCTSYCDNNNAVHCVTYCEGNNNTGCTIDCWGNNNTSCTSVCHGNNNPQCISGCSPTAARRVVPSSAAPLEGRLPGHPPPS